MINYYVLVIFYVLLFLHLTMIY